MPTCLELTALGRVKQGRNLPGIYHDSGYQLLLACVCLPARSTQDKNDEGKVRNGLQ